MSKKIRSTIIVDDDLWKEVRILAIRKDMEIGELVQESLREKIAREYQEEQELIQEAKRNRVYFSQMEHQIQKLNSIFDQQSLQINLPGINFPANKNRIIECAGKANIAKVTDNLKNLPDKVYENSRHLEEALKKIFKDEINIYRHDNKDKKYVKTKSKILRFIINQTEDNIQLPRQIQLQEQQLSG